MYQVAIEAPILLNTLTLLSHEVVEQTKINYTSCKTDCSRAGRQFIASVWKRMQTQIISLLIYAFLYDSYIYITFYSFIWLQYSSWSIKFYISICCGRLCMTMSHYQLFTINLCFALCFLSTIYCYTEEEGSNYRWVHGGCLFFLQFTYNNIIGYYYSLFGLVDQTIDGRRERERDTHTDTQGTSYKYQTFIHKTNTH